MTARTRKKQRNRIIGGFCPITFDFIDSKVFRELHGAALKAFILCLRKVKTSDPYDRFKLSFSLTYPEAVKGGIPGASFKRGMRQLQTIGLIDCVQRGGLSCGVKTPSLYKLSKRWHKYGSPEFEAHHNGFAEAVHA